LICQPGKVFSGLKALYREGNQMAYSFYNNYMDSIKKRAPFGKIKVTTP